MKKLILLTLSLLLVIASCKNKTKNSAATQPATSVVSDSTQALKAFAITDTLLPQSVDLQQDITPYSMQELRLLRSYPYALHGYHFMEADINAFFSNSTKWYDQLVWKLFEDPDSLSTDKFTINYDEVKLTPAEKAFVERVDKRIAELRKRQTLRQWDLTLNNPDNVVNLFQFKDIDTTVMQRLRQSNFTIVRGHNLQLFHLYEENDYRQVPNFITTDLYLQAFHIYYSYIMKSLEKQHFIPALEQICLTFYQQSMALAGKPDTETSLRDLAEFTATFFAIPYHLLTGEELTIPTTYKEAYRGEIGLIEGGVDNLSKLLPDRGAYFPYSLFKPRGHYSREPKMQAYFRAMMWLQVADLCREDEQQLQRALFQAMMLNTAKLPNGKTPLIRLYQQVATPLTFLTGTPDNLSIIDLATFLTEKYPQVRFATLLEPYFIGKITPELEELAKQRNVIHPKEELTCRDKINFLPQRYLLDNEVLQELVDVTPDANRAYPKGLDVLAALGVKSAEELLTGLYKEPENWSEYTTELQKLQKKFEGFTRKLPQSVYDSWMGSLVTLQQVDPACPSFMKTPDWGYKNLNTALASWAELKHDAVLYGEQPQAAECGGAGPPDPIVVGYVEPNFPFWDKMLDLVNDTQDVLVRNDCFSSDLRGKTEQLRNYLQFVIQVTQKEQKKEKLTEQEYRTIQYMGSSLENFTLSVLDPDLNLDDWSLVQGPDKSVAVVADIYTRNVPGCSKDGILHVGNGLANDLYVVVEIEGNLYLLRGATFSYYEFVRPLGTRLTDEEWQQMLEDGQAPPVPEWMNKIVLDPEKEPRVDERVFYSSGC
ncbi:MAG: DUF3160 domain-containing protein [Mediterranea sp.]|jgi:hypothetical protein|nr:DUF3160 domain-containing protein [Mediterranea sp.]